MNSHSAGPGALPSQIDHYENFPVASFLCPKHLRAPIIAIYQFARAADDIADEGTATATERLRDLAAFRIDLMACSQRLPISTRWPAIFTPLGHMIDAFKLPVGLLTDLLDAFEQDVAKSRDSAGYETHAELLDYCRRSADPIGKILLHLNCAATPQHITWSNSICSALQLLNHWQDVAIDWQKNDGGRVYLPQDEMRE